MLPFHSNLITKNRTSCIFNSETENVVQQYISCIWYDFVQFRRTVYQHFENIWQSHGRKTLTKHAILLSSPWCTCALASSRQQYFIHGTWFRNTQSALTTSVHCKSSIMIKTREWLKKEKKRNAISLSPLQLVVVLFAVVVSQNTLQFACQVGLKMTHNVDFWRNKTTKSIFHACLADVHHPQICVAVMVLRTIMSSKPQQTILLVETRLNWSWARV